MHSLSKFSCGCDSELYVCNASLTCEASVGQLCECMCVCAVRVKVRVHACVCVWGGGYITAVFHCSTYVLPPHS